jgi:cell division protein FtsI (penicillin-binding protein 3)
MFRHKTLENKPMPSRKIDQVKKARERKGMRGVRTVALFSVGALALASLSQLDRQVLRTDKPLVAFGLGKKGKLAAPPFRGPILAADGRMVAESIDSYKLSLHYKTLPTAPAFFADLSQSTGLPPSELTALREKKTAAGKPVTASFDQGLSPTQVERAKGVQEKWQTAGLTFEERPERLRPLGEAVADLVGAASFEEDRKQRKTLFVGRYGLENSLNGHLTGTGPLPSAKRARIAGLTDEIRKRVDAASGPNPERRGVVLTIDSGMQQAAYEAVRKAVIRTSAAGGSALVLEPKSGDLLASADYPPGRTITGVVNGEEQGYLYGPTDAAFEPGSTWKLLTMALAYDLRLMSPGDTFVSTSSLAMPRGRPIRNHGGKAFGAISPGQAMAYSCNTTTARWALGIGQDRYYKWLKSTGAVENRAGLGMATETRGLFHYGTSIRDLASVGFGQGINLTPASLIGLFGMIANEGKYVSPRLIRSLGGIDLPSEVRGQFLSPEACRETLRAAEMVVTEPGGTGHKLQIPGLRFGGKTGTAQIIKAEAAIGYRANFVGFVPAEKPKYVILVMVDRPSHADYYGASVAGPAFVDIAKALVAQGKVSGPSLAQAEPLPSARPAPEAPARAAQPNPTTRRAVEGQVARTNTASRSTSDSNSTRRSSARTTEEKAPPARPRSERAEERTNTSRRTTERSETKADEKRTPSSERRRSEPEKKTEPRRKSEE